MVGVRGKGYKRGWLGSLASVHRALQPLKHLPSLCASSTTDRSKGKYESA